MLSIILCVYWPFFCLWSPFSRIDFLLIILLLKKKKIVSHFSRPIQKANLAQSVLNISLLVEWHSTQREILPSRYLVSSWELAPSLQMAVLSPTTPVYSNRKSIPREQHRNPWQEGTCLHCPFKTHRQGLPWWLSSKEFCQCRRQEFVRSLIQEDPICCRAN